LRRVCRRPVQDDSNKRFGCFPRGTRPAHLLTLIDFIRTRKSVSQNQGEVRKSSGDCSSAFLLKKLPLPILGDPPEADHTYSFSSLWRRGSQPGRFFSRGSQPGRLFSPNHTPGFADNAHPFSSYRYCPLLRNDRDADHNYGRIPLRGPPCSLILIL